LGWIGHHDYASFLV